MSAGLLPYRLPFAVLIGHPGGPFFAQKDAGAWSLMKGEVAPGEEATAAAAREFTEETGWECPLDNWLDLGSIRLRSGKTVFGWAVEADFDPDLLDPGQFTMFWHGRNQTFPGNRPRPMVRRRQGPPPPQPRPSPFHRPSTANPGFVGLLYRPTNPGVRQKMGSDELSRVALGVVELQRRRWLHPPACRSWPV